MALTDKQREQRKGLITSSIVAGCLGVDARITPIQAALRARGELTAADAALAGTKACQRGDRLEALCLDSVAEDHDWRWRVPPFSQRHDAPWAGDSADAIYYDGMTNQPVALGEAKTAALGMAGGFGEDGSDEVPHAVYLQCQWHLWHYPYFARCYVPVLVGGYRFEFRTYLVERDLELISIIVPQLQEFHQRYVLGAELPSVSAGDTEYLRKRWPTNTDAWASDSPQLQALVLERVKAAEALKRAEHRKETASNLLREYLEDKQGAKGSWGAVYYRRTKGRVKVDWERIALNLANGEVPEELMRAHTHIAPGPRMLRVHPKKGAFDNAA